MATQTCESCLYRGTGSYGVQCALYPKWIQVHAGHWCGQFVQKAPDRRTAQEVESEATRRCDAKACRHEWGETAILGASHRLRVCIWCGAAERA